MLIQRKKTSIRFFPDTLKFDYARKEIISSENAIWRINYRLYVTGGDNKQYEVYGGGITIKIGQYGEVVGIDYMMHPITGSFTENQIIPLTNDKANLSSLIYLMDFGKHLIIPYYLVLPDIENNRKNKNELDEEVFDTYYQSLVNNVRPYKDEKGKEFFVTDIVGVANGEFTIPLEPDKLFPASRYIIGKVQGAGCYCNRNFVGDELKDIIVNLRKENGYISLAGVLFDMKADEKLANVSWYKFTMEINAMFSKYSINTCLRKTHFLAQSAVETLFFRKTYEGLLSAPSYEGGVHFQGRGMIQITQDYNYLEYYDYVKGMNYCDRYKELQTPDPKTKQQKINLGGSVTNYIETNPDDTILTAQVLEDLRTFAKTLSTELQRATDSAGWYWSEHLKDGQNKLNINSIADIDNTVEVSKSVNNPFAKTENQVNNLSERKKYTIDLKKIMDYENCKNKI